MKTKASRAMKNEKPLDVPAEEGFFPTLWLMASYLLLSIVFFLPALIPGQMLYGSDHLAESYFSELFADSRFAAGALPKWNPFLFGGFPFYANAMDTYYPVTMLLRAIGVPTYQYPLFIFITQLFVGGAGTYLLLRELGARRFPAYLSGLMYMFAGYSVSFILGGHDGRMIVATLAPLFFFAIHRALATARLRWFVLGGVVIGLANLSNQIQSTYYMLLGGFLWMVYLLWKQGHLRAPRALAVRAGGAILALVIGFGMVAVNFLPFASYIAHSPRGGEGGRGYEYATSWSMPPAEITGVAVPEHHGLLEAYSGANPFKLHTEYAGALAILGVVLGAYLVWRNRDARFFGVLALVTLSISFGGHTPIYRLYYAILPGTDKFRAPSISFYLFALSLVVIAGLALDRLAELRAERESRSRKSKGEATSTLETVKKIGLGLLAVIGLWAIIALVTSPSSGGAAMRTVENHQAYVLGVLRFGVFLAASAAALWFWVRGSISTRTAGVLLAVVTVADLWIIDKKFMQVIPEPRISLAADDITHFLREQPKPFRAFVLFDLQQDNYLAQHGVELVGGHHPNALQSFNEFLGAGENTYTDFHNMGNPNFLALANAKYLVTQQQMEVPFLRPVYQGRSRSGGMAFVYENLAALPRAFVVPSATRAADRDAALERMNAPDFDPAREVVLYVDPPLPASATPEAFEAKAEIIRHEPDEVEIRVEAAESGYLVLTDNYYEDWNASIDGEPVEVLRANHTFRAVPVPAGSHTVVFRFEPRSVTIGFAISLTLWILLALYGAGLGVQAWRRRKEAAA